LAAFGGGAKGQAMSTWTITCSDGRTAQIEADEITSRNVVEQARRAPGCLDFAISADLVEPGRIDIFERWESQAAVEAFRSNGPSDQQVAAIQAASVAEYDVVDGVWLST
jgi:quinol monooxygenase YgiN